MKKLHWLLLALGTLASVGARWYQFLFCYDEQGLPVAPAGLLCLVPLVCLVLFILLTRRAKDSGREMQALFDFSGTLPLFCAVLGAFVLIAAAVALFLGGVGGVTVILPLFLAVSGACALYVSVCLKKGIAFPGIAAGFPAAYLSVQLVFTYRECAKDPVLVNFFVELLALAAFAWAFVQLSAFAFRTASPRSYLPTAMLSVVLGVTGALTASSLFWMLMLGGFAFVQLAFLSAYRE
ncbi:MAG: hypothetical protein IKL99_05735 [Oscillospiraceae bacterium]|nr:hypothetical protein [Oscillospiraceae bacterium]